MYDTIWFRQLQAETEETRLLEEVPCFLSDVSEHLYNDGKSVCVSGMLGNLKVSVSDYQMKIQNSLCKWYCGDNYQTLTRGDVKKAVEALSDALHVDISRAEVKRLDVAQNLVLKHQPDIYIKHLGQLQGFERGVQQDGLYYFGKGKQGKQQLVFYDKNKETIQDGEAVPELYKGQNVFRYEQRYKAPYKQLGINTASMLWDEALYKRLFQKWSELYNSIHKLNDIEPDFSKMKTKKDLQMLGVLALVGLQGGQLSFEEVIKEAQKRGELTAKQAFDLKRAVNDACSLNAEFTRKSEAVTELDKKMKDAVRFYH